MMIGSLGSIPFYASVDESVLMSGLEWDTRARYAEHTRHRQTDMLEYVGQNPDQITFDIKLSAFLGVNPSRMLERFNTIIKQHEAVKFVLGTMPIPGYWVMTDLKRQLEYFHKDGTLLSVDLTVTLQEYVERVTMPIISNRLTFTDRMASAIAVYPTPGPDRKPTIPATAQPVRVNPNPPTNPRKPPNTTAAASPGKTIGTVVGLGIRAVRAVSDVVKKYNVVEVLKNAFSNRSYNATKAAPATPVVVRKDSGVNPNSSSHSRWINTVK